MKINSLHSMNFVEIACIRKEKSGLPVILWISPKLRDYYNDVILVMVSRSYANYFDESNTFILFHDKGTWTVDGDPGEIKEKDVKKVKTLLSDDAVFNVLTAYWTRQADEDDVKKIMIKRSKVLFKKNHHPKPIKAPQEGLYIDAP